MKIKVLPWLLGACLLLGPALQAEPLTLDTVLTPLTDKLLRDLQISLIKDLELKEPKTIAVLTFQPMGRSAPSLGVLLTEEMTAQLFGQGFWKLVERQRLDQLLKEQGFGQSALANAETALNLGKLAGAEAILVGSYTEFGDSLRLHLRLISVESGTVLAAGVASLDGSLLAQLKTATETLQP